MAKTPGNLPLIYGLVGRINVEWSRFELNLDQCVYVLYVRCGGSTIKPDIRRTSFTFKKDFVRGCMRKLPLLEPFAADFLPILERATNLSKERNEKVHGAVFSDEGQEEYFRFIAWNFNLPQPKIQQTEMSLDELHDLGERIEALGIEMAKLSARFFDRFGR
jgi:hypothetical protein